MVPRTEGHQVAGGDGGVRDSHLGRDAQVSGYVWGLGYSRATPTVEYLGTLDLLDIRGNSWEFVGITDLLAVI
jgi:hypothetical protein